MRTCSSCSECCTTLGVPSLGKAPGEPCPHDKGRGTYRCGLHGSPERPPECAAFSCLWQGGGLPSGLRPDSAGVVVAYQDTKLGASLVLHESRDGAATQPRALPTVAKVTGLAARHGAVVFVASPGGGRRLVITRR